MERLPVVVETLNYLTSWSSAHMTRVAAGEHVARLGTAGESLRSWSEIVGDMRQVLLRRVVNEDLNAEGGDGWGAEEDYDF